ncbi:MBL fold metallo-hydrolase [Fervidicoccus fontis]|uniref:MBL fold metallo-hydrolase n=1 Tax=Fervidicoccus fontis TaxID=683846 RepID=A0A2J6N2A0_9CREN|nr:MBL fold metallo-hydrolase [Fervidicoccus fontis]PMB75462.1 MAG: hypothetical protein C0188_03015 [Fervidicoccus fontis]PMB77327.1 MAG: hypothetical protein C0177_03455 [Fervidicoccus fontis]PMB78615.1 MAG: hypothetical protein C0177_00035 [Fervidicoccus fontis]HEW63763.1 MBL fold metallo-hydrolase [Fervidicoccus fontis]
MEKSSKFLIFKGRTNVLIVTNDNKEAIIVDTGIDEDSGRKIAKFLNQNSLTPVAIINSHSHADHIGGNSYLEKKFKIQSYSTKNECAFIENPLLEPLYLYEAFPPESLTIKTLAAEPSSCNSIEEFNINEFGIEIIRLPGHSIDMIGLKIGGELLFTADAFFGIDTLIKHKIPYHVNVKNSYLTLLMLKEEVKKFNAVLPSHGDLIQSQSEAEDAILKNINAILEVRDLIVNSFESKKEVESVISQVLNHYGFSDVPLAQYFLLKSAIMSYFAWLLDEKILSLETEDGRLVAKKI